MLDANGNNRPPARPFPVALSAMLRASDGILDLLPIATFICDSHGVILQYNKRAADIWGRVPKPGQTHDQFGEELSGAERSIVSEVLTTGVPVREAERIVEHADGSRVIVSMNIDPLRNAKGELVGAVS